MTKKISKETALILTLAVIKLLIHLFTNTNYELHRDALLYYSLGEHPALGYLSVPPLIGVFAKLSTLLFGHSVFALRFFPALIGSISVVIIAKMVKELGGGIWAIIIAALAFILSPAFLRSNTLFQPVSFNQFFWLLSGYLIIKLLKTTNPKFWLYIFLVWGIAFLNKYSIAFFIVAFLLAILLTSHRQLMKSKYFFIGGGIGLFIILPNLLWQVNHNWPLMHHMSELYETQFANVSVKGFLIGQLFMNFPALIVWITGLIVFLFFKAEKNYRAIGLGVLITVLIILFLHGKSYYTLGLYSILFALGGYAIERYFKPYLRYAVLAIMVLFCLPLIPISLPVYSFEKIENYTKPMAQFVNQWEDGKIHNIPQDYSDMTGWKELSTIVTNFYQSLPEEEQNNCAIYADNYGQAGAVYFYGGKKGLPAPISFNDNFLLWAPDQVEKEELIYINHELGDIKDLFQSYRLIGQVDDPYFRENGLQVYYCTNPNNNFKSFYANKVASLKKNYTRP